MTAHISGQACCKVFNVPWVRLKPTPAGGGGGVERQSGAQRFDGIRPVLLWGRGGRMSTNPQLKLNKR